MTHPNKIAEKRWSECSFMKIKNPTKILKLGNHVKFHVKFLNLPSDDQTKVKCNVFFYKTIYTFL